MNRLLARSLNSMVYLLLRYPLDSAESENNYLQNLTGELEVWLGYLAQEVTPYVQYNEPSEVVKYLITVLSEEFTEGSYFTHMDPDTYFEKLKAFVTECTTDQNILRFFSQVYNSCTFAKALIEY